MLAPKTNDLIPFQVAMVTENATEVDKLSVEVDKLNVVVIPANSSWQKSSIKCGHDMLFVKFLTLF